MTSQATSAKSVRAESLPYDAIAVNLVRLAGLSKDKARECEEIVRQVLAAQAAPAQPELPEDPIALLDLVRQNFTRDDDLPDDLLPRIDAVIAAATPADTPAPLLIPTNRDRCGSGFEQRRPTPPFAPGDPSDDLGGALRWPQSPQDVKDMIGSSFTAAKFVNQGEEIGMHSIPAHEMDTYTVTAHDLLEAFGHWRDFVAPNAGSHAGGHFGGANEMVDTESTVELHVPVPLSEKQRGKLLSGVCSLVTRHDIPVERVRLIATHDGIAQGRPVANDLAAPLSNGLAALSDEQLRDALMEAIDATMTRCRVSWSHWRNWPGTWTFATDLVPVVRKLAQG